MKERLPALNEVPITSLQCMSLVNNENYICEDGKVVRVETN